jgi:hypothetical protein
LSTKKLLDFEKPELLIPAEQQQSKTPPDKEREEGEITDDDDGERSPKSKLNPMAKRALAAEVSSDDSDDDFRSHVVRKNRGIRRPFQSILPSSDEETDSQGASKKMARKE